MLLVDERGEALPSRRLLPPGLHKTSSQYMALGAKLEGGGYPPIGVVVIGLHSLPCNFLDRAIAFPCSMRTLPLPPAFAAAARIAATGASNHIGIQFTLLRPCLKGQGTIDWRHGSQEEIPGEEGEAGTVYALGICRLWLGAVGCRLLGRHGRFLAAPVAGCRLHTVF